MAGEFVHADVGGELTEAEYHSLVAHVLDDQVRGDLIVSNSAATGLTRLAIGAEDSLLVAGADDPQWSTLRWSGSNLGPSTDVDLLGLAAGVLTLRGQADIEGYAAFGNGSPLNSQTSFIIDRDHSVSSGLARGLDIDGIHTFTGGTADSRHLEVRPGGVVINSGNTHTTVTSAYFYEPSITLTSGSVTNGVTVYIANAPNEGTNNYALWVDAGDVRFDGNFAGVGGGTWHVQAVGTADVELEVSNNSSQGGGTIHRASSATHSLRELKSDIVYLNDAQEMQGPALADVLALRHVDFRYRREVYDDEGVLLRREDDASAPLHRGLVFEDAPPSIRDEGHGALVVDRRLANVEMAVQEVVRRVELL
ncbi:MAG: hypothetical protein V3R95_09720, partial [Dehalococcoidia bacterium]